MGREDEYKYALAINQYFHLQPRDYYGRYTNGIMLCSTIQTQLVGFDGRIKKSAVVEIEELKKRVEAIFGKSILGVQLLLECADDLEQSWTIEYAPMRTKTMTVYEAVCILDSFREQVDKVIAKNFLMLGGIPIS